MEARSGVEPDYTDLQSIFATSVTGFLVAGAVWVWGQYRTKWSQLAIVTISGTSNRSGAVFAGSAAALVLASLLGAGAGGSLSAVIPPNALQLAASIGFLVIGLRLVIKSGQSDDGAEDTTTTTP